MIEIRYVCDKCESIVTSEVLDIDDSIDELLPEGWIIFERGTPDELVLCQDCIDWNEMENSTNW